MRGFPVTRSLKGTSESNHDLVSSGAAAFLCSEFGLIEQVENRRKLQVRERHLSAWGKAIQRDIAALMGRLAGDFGSKPRREFGGFRPLLVFKLDGENITAVGIYDTIKLNFVAAGAALDGEMQPIIGDLPDAEVEQRLGMSPGNRG
jgi:hypothetical protein